MTDKLTTIFNEFKSSELNELAGTLITRNKDALAELREAQELLTKALLRHFLNGKDVHENYYLILEECSTQREFANRIGLSESVLSNDLRAYRALEERGVETPKQFRELLDRKGIQPTVSNWEKLPTLLEDPTQNKRDTRPKDEKRLEQIYQELDEIKSRNVTDTVNYEAEAMQQEIVDVTKEILKQDPRNLEWENDRYLDYIRSYGYDILTGEPLPDDLPAHPHHVDPFTGAAGGGTGNKLPDCFTVPLHPDNHRDIHDGKGDYTPEDYQKALITVLTNFIIKHVR